MGHVFDSITSEYYLWHDTPEGSDVFRAERDCLLSLYRGPFGAWLEVGVGTGRFAHILGIATGVDPSQEMLAIAARRGIAAIQGTAERLPFAQGSFDGVLMALTLCFVADARQALLECHRVLPLGGRLLIGVVPSDSAWGCAYRRKAAWGHPVYAHAHFRSAAETTQLARCAGFSLRDTAGTLLWEPGQTAGPHTDVKSSSGRKAGFTGFLFAKIRENRV